MKFESYFSRLLLKQKLRSENFFAFKNRALHALKWNNYQMNFLFTCFINEISQKIYFFKISPIIINVRQWNVSNNEYKTNNQQSRNSLKIIEKKISTKECESISISWYDFSMMNVRCNARNVIENVFEADAYAVNCAWSSWEEWGISMTRSVRKYIFIGNFLTFTNFIKTQ